MFTGIIEEMGHVMEVAVTPAGGTLEVGARRTLRGLRIGESIAVNGVCLTVTAKGQRSFRCDLMGETLRRTNLGLLRLGDTVNLERSLRADDRMGGHFVQGHVDGVAEIVDVQPEGDSVWLRFRAPQELLRYIVPKGFVAIDGASLTVVDVGEDSSFTISLVRYTRENVTLGSKGPGYQANVEVDMLGKYIEYLVAERLARAGRQL
ncbi:MAG: riboflavin synthase [Chloroflexi bacterium]|nr:riboflavin synthase [Chloroflexota bacterium]